MPANIGFIARFARFRVLEPDRLPQRLKPTRSDAVRARLEALPLQRRETPLPLGFPA